MLIIAEKPSLARAIAAVLPGAEKKGDHIECSNGTQVAWCAGHVLELASPEDYDPSWKAWRLELLPVVPSEWKLRPTSAELLRTIERLAKKADRVVNAGDPDREGQLLVDEVLEFIGYRGPVDRLHINDYNPAAVRAALGALKPNELFRGVYESALGRQRADWLYGLNMTRLYTALGRNGGYDGVLSVGRVQTPVLGLVVRRDLEIENFQPRAYWTLNTLVKGGGGVFRARWVAGKSVEGALDEEGRLVQQQKAREIQERTSGQCGRVVKYERVRKQRGPPLPFSLATLQVEAGRALGLSPKETLDAAQALYETHRLTTYPRSDCTYLPEVHLGDVGAVLEAIAATAPALRSVIEKADRSVRSLAWSDAKVSAHHAIIPTAKHANVEELERKERALYELIARRYVAQFYGPLEWDQTTVELDVTDERFVASGREAVAQGWRAVLEELDGKEDVAEAEEDEAERQSLPAMREGEEVVAVEVTIREKATKPPQRFTEAGLITAMTGVARYVSDARVRQVLQETDGIGTPATQASIIETLFERQYIEKRGRQIVSTGTGRAMIGALPAMTTVPDMTALWELALRKVEERAMPLTRFLSGVENQVRKLIEDGKARGTLEIPGAHACPKCGAWLRQRRGSKGVFWACSKSEPNGGGCRYTAEDAKGRPVSGGEEGRRKRRGRRVGRRGAAKS